MNEPAFLADEEFRGDIVQAALRFRSDIDLVTVHQPGLDGTPDEQLLDIAARAGRIILSHDVNTMIDEARRRIDSGRTMSGLLLARQSASRKAVVETLVLISAASEVTDWDNVIDFLPW